MAHALPPHGWPWVVVEVQRWSSGSLEKETKEEKEDELASGSRAWEKGKEDPTSGSLGKEAKVEKEDKLAFGRALVREMPDDPSGFLGPNSLASGSMDDPTAVAVHPRVLPQAQR
mgnify:CR=1 FL=1